MRGMGAPIPPILAVAERLRRFFPFERRMPDEQEISGALGRGSYDGFYDAKFGRCSRKFIIDMKETALCISRALASATMASNPAALDR